MRSARQRIYRYASSMAVYAIKLLGIEGKSMLFKMSMEDNWRVMGPSK